MCLAVLCLLAAAAPDAGAEAFDAHALAGVYGIQGSSAWENRPPRGPHLAWARGDCVLQGFIGANIYDTIERSGGSIPDVDGSHEDASQLPVIGGGMQYKVGGTGLDFGLEGMFSFAGRANATAFAVGGGGATVAVSLDLLVFELYGGAFVSCFLGDSARVYVAGGPLMEWVDYTQDTPDTSMDGSSSGFGTGAYVRAGIEFAVEGNLMIGMGVRWSRSRVDLDNTLGELDVEGFQWALTVTEGF